MSTQIFLYFMIGAIIFVFAGLIFAFVIEFRNIPTIESKKKEEDDEDIKIIDLDKDDTTDKE